MFTYVLHLYSNYIVDNISVILITNTLYYYTGNGYWYIGRGIRSAEQCRTPPQTNWEYWDGDGRIVYKPDPSLTVSYHY